MADQPPWSSGGGGGGGGGGPTLPGQTADTGVAVRWIALEAGGEWIAKAIPADAAPPTTPGGLARVVRLTSVRLTWNGAARAAAYRVMRDGALLATVTGATAYRDGTVEVGETYDYTVRAVDQYGQWSNLSTGVEAFIDPALNSAPSVLIAQYGPFVRVTARDVDVQQLEIDANVDSGTLDATDDVSLFRVVSA